MKIARISPPRLRTITEEGERAATWLELFYDLAFVVAVASLGGRLLDDITWTGLASYFAYFALLWWLWASHTFYADRYDTDDLVYRLLAAVQMVAIVIIAGSLGSDGSTIAFAIGYALARLVLVGMYYRAHKHVHETKALVRGYLTGFGAAAALWTLSILAPEPLRFYVWAVALAVDLATPYVMRRDQAKVPLDVTHLPERFGLFTILVLGESIAAVVAGLGHVDWLFAPTSTAVFGIGLATALWWMYFDNAEGSVIRRRDRGGGKTWRPTAWIYTHLPLAAALAAVGVALDHAVVEAGHGPFPTGERWLLVGAVIFAFGSLALIQFSTADFTPARAGIVRNRLLGIPPLLIIGVLAIGSGWITLLVLLVCAVQVVADIWVWDRHEGSDRSRAT